MLCKGRKSNRLSKFQEKNLLRGAKALSGKKTQDSKLPNVKAKKKLETPNTRKKWKGPFQCPLCAKSFSKVDNLKNHVENVHPEPEWNPRSETEDNQSKSPGQKEPSNASQEENIKEDANENISEEVDEDINEDESFNEISKNETHSKNGEKHLACSYGDKKFPSASDGKRHEMIHSGEKPNACSFCEKKFSRSYVVQTHEMIHTGEKPFACSFCDKTFRLKLTLKQHETIHTGEKAFACRFCDKRFNKKFTVNRHERTHTGEKPYACNICGKKYRVLSTHKKHELYCKDKTNANLDEDQSKKAEIKLKDNEDPGQNEVSIDKEVPKKVNLQQHQSIHTGEKPYSCSICDKKFTRKDSVKKHKLIHTKEKPEIIHTKEKTEIINKKEQHIKEKKISKCEEDDLPKCPFCSESFTAIDNLNKHIEEKHPELVDLTNDPENDQSQNSNLETGLPQAEKKNKAKKRRKSKAKQYSLSHEKVKKATKSKKPYDFGKKFLKSSNTQRHSKTDTNQIVFHKTRSTRSKSKNIKEDLMDKESNHENSTDIFVTNTTNLARNKIIKAKVDLENSKYTEENTSITEKNTSVAEEYSDSMSKDEISVTKEIVALTEENTYVNEENTSLNKKNIPLNEKEDTLISKEDIFMTEKGNSMTTESTTITVEKTTDTEECASINKKNTSIIKEGPLMTKNNSLNYRDTASLTTYKTTDNLGKKSYACSFCNKKGNAKIHANIHTGEKPYACSFCDKSFRLKQTLKQHEKIHIGEKPFACSFCDTRFNNKFSLNQHERTHNGEKPYACNICGKKSRVLSNHKKHELYCKEKKNANLDKDQSKKPEIKLNDNEDPDQNEVSIDKEDPNTLAGSSRTNEGQKLSDMIDKKSYSKGMLRNKAKKRTLIKVKNENGKVKIPKISKQIKVTFLPEENSCMIVDNSSVQEKNTVMKEEIPSLIQEITEDIEDNPKVEENTFMKDENISQMQKSSQIKTSHNDDPKKIKILECEFCEENFGEETYRNDKKYREHLKIHMKSQKSYEKSNKDKENLPLCELCDHRSKANISTHSKTVHKITKKLKKDIECFICYLETTTIEGPGPRILFHSYEGIRIHIKRQHETEDWTYACKRCDSKFASFYGLELHMKSFHAWKSKDTNKFKSS